MNQILENRENVNLQCSAHSSFEEIYIFFCYLILCLKMELNVYINWKQNARGKLSLRDMTQKDADMLSSGIPVLPCLVFFTLIFMYYWLSSSLRVVFMFSPLAMLRCLLVHGHTFNDNYLDNVMFEPCCSLITLFDPVKEGYCYLIYFVDIIRHNCLGFI